MRYAKSFAMFWYDFVVGDDWTMAVGVTAALFATWLVARAGVAAWPIVVIAVSLLVTTSVMRARRATRAAAAANATAGHSTPVPESGAVDGSPR